MFAIPREPGAQGEQRVAIIHVTPVQTAAVLLDGVPRIEDCEWVFTGSRTNKPPIEDAKKAGTRIAQRVLAELRESDATIATFNFRGHDLRRTASTKMAEAGVSQADISKLLNHVEGGPRATMVYNRYAYDKEKRIALETWDRVLTAILEQKESARVVPFSSGQRQ